VRRAGPAGPAAVLALIAGAAAGAQEFVPGPYFEVLAECYAAAGDGAARRACIGRPSGLCAEEEPRGGTTEGMATCAGIEADAWDVLVEGEFRATVDWARTADAASPEGFRDRVAANRAAQDAWETWSVEACRAEHARRGQDPMRRVALARCRMRMAAERAIGLREMRDAP
jgi:uncharacterized protein YecT (DUF1311 family)